MTGSINRRKMLASGGAAVAGGLALACPALASTDSVPAGADAALRRLLDRWFAQLGRAEKARARWQDAEEKARLEVGRLWRFDDVTEMPAPKDGARFEARFTAYHLGRPMTRCVPMEAATLQEAERLSLAMGQMLRQEHDKACKAADRRHGVEKLEAAYRVEDDKSTAIEAAIAGTPAEGLFGLAVKLSLTAFYELPEADDCAARPSLSAYGDLARLIGRDLAKEALAAARAATA